MTVTISDLVSDPFGVDPGIYESLIPDVGEPWFQENRDLFEGDHWGEGEYWVGPMVDPTDPWYWTIMEAVQRLFTSKNVVLEVISRHAKAVTRNNPVWVITMGEPGSDEEETGVNEALIAEAEHLLNLWWKSSAGVIEGESQPTTVSDVFKNAVEAALWGSRGPLRLYLPISSLTKRDRDSDESGPIVYTLPRFSSPTDALSRILIHGADPAKSAVVTDFEVLKQLGFYVGSDETGRYVEISFVDEAGLTVLGEVRDNGAETSTRSYSLDLGRVLWFHQITTPPLINPSFRSLQKQLNMTLTMLGRNTVHGGALERILLNAKVPSLVSFDANAGEFSETPQDFEVGAGVTSFLVGLKMEAPDGTVTYTTPSVVYRDPVSPGTFVEAAAFLYRSMLDAVGQTFVLLGPEASASGLSRQEARADFEDTLVRTKSSYLAALTWGAQCVLKLVGVLMGQTDRYSALTISADIQTYLGPITTETRTGVINQFEAGLMSRETALSLLGITNVAEELDRLRQDREEQRLQQSNSLAEAFLKAQIVPGQFPAAPAIPAVPAIEETEELEVS